MAARRLLLDNIKKHLPEEVTLKNKIEKRKGPGKILTFDVSVSRILL